MTHDVDALAESLLRAAASAGIALYEEAATALRAEHEARVKAEAALGEKDREHLAWLSLLSTMSTERANELIAQRFAAVQPDLQNAEARATAAEAQLARAREALEPFAREAVAWPEYVPDWQKIGRDMPIALTLGDLRRAREVKLPDGWRKRDTDKAAARVAEGDTGQGLSETGQNVSESENAAGTEDHMIKAPLPKWITDRYGDTPGIRERLQAWAEGRGPAPEKTEGQR